ncbi:MAG: gamma-glutamyltransferase [Bacteroidetes bacterium]|nr:MAG: gamma-glutamyltransferase [Bacteroidota bacterium]
MKKSLLLISIYVLVISCNSLDEHSEIKYTGPIAQNGMVVTAHPLASLVGRQILEKGGNAIDAAIATQFALAVVYPYAGNLGGGGFMVLREANGNTSTLDFREMAPLAAHKDMYLDEDGEIIENLSIQGHLAAGVPGTVDGMIRAHEKYGTLPWVDLLMPSVILALQGFAVTDTGVDRLNSKQEEFQLVNTFHPQQFIRDWQSGDTLIQLDLAATLTRIRDKGRDGFYNGLTAKLILEEMTRGNGIITQEDLDLYEAKWRPAIKATYRDHKIITMPPPSSGGIALIQMLESVEPYALNKIGHNSADYVHLLVEAERRAFADRAKYLGDMDFYNVPIVNLIDRSYILKRMKSFDPKLATPSEDIGSGSIQVESDQTTHFSIIDSYGNAVAVTTTLNGAYGSKVVVGSAGFLLNNEMDDFSIKPGFPNMFGLIGGSANAIEPKKRMLSSMTPTIIEKDGEILFVTGSPGGATIITSVFQSVLNIIDFGMSAQEAVTAKRFHSQWLPDVITIEDGALDENTMATLRERGHKFLIKDNIGRVDAIKRLKDGNLEGGADPRGDDKAEGY